MLLWTLAVASASSAFVVHLALRGKTVQTGYLLGKARAEQSRLRETKRVLELEVASNETPQRVENVARALLSMTPPSPDRVIPVKVVTGGARKKSPSKAKRTAASGGER